MILKRGFNLLAFLLILNIFILSLVSISYVSAQSIGESGIPTGMEQDLEKIQNTSDKARDAYSNLSNNETRDEYLKKEWKKIFSKNKYLSPIFNFFDKILNFFNPFFKIVLGVEYDLSWAFIFALAIWMILFMFLYQPVGALFNNTAFGIIGSFIITSLIGLSGVIKKAVELLSTAITERWLIGIAIFVTIIIGIIIVYFGGNLKKFIEQQKEKHEKEKTEQHRKIIETSADIEKEKMKGYEQNK
jgi:hypothetical protein